MTPTQPLIFGEVLFDCFPDGNRILGGAPFNVAWHLQAFGLQPILISRIGDDSPGKDVATAMNDWGMATDFLQLDHTRPTGTVTILLNNGEPSYTISPDDAYGHITDCHDTLPANPSLLYHGSLALYHPEARNSLEKIKHQCQAPIFVDVNLRAPWWQRDTVLGLLAGAAWIKLNEEELGLLIESGTTTERKAKTMLEHFQLLGVIVTRGKKGADIFLQGEQQLSIAPAATTRIVDTVGAGDAFSAVFIAGLISKQPIKEILVRAQNFASAIVGQQGAVPENLEFYKKFT